MNQNLHQMRLYELKPKNISYVNEKPTFSKI